jgi:hypothetical protein
MIELCAERGVLYLDTVTEPWEGGYTDKARSSRISVLFAVCVCVCLRVSVLAFSSRMHSRLIVLLPMQQALSIVDRSNYGQRQEVVELKHRLAREHPEGTSTAVTVSRLTSCA